MRFLHTADLHLDSAFSSVGSIDSSSRRAAQRDVLRRIFDVATSEKCDMILIAGDLFDSAYVSPETAALCLELFESFKKPIVISPGNHDPYTAGSFYATAALPKNVHVFDSAELTKKEFFHPEVTVYGYAFSSTALMNSPLTATAEDKRGMTVLCAHGDLEVPTSRYAPVMLSDLRRHQFDYVALGHVHNSDGDGKAVRYSGFPEGRSFDELGEGGVLIVDLQPGCEPVVTRKSVCSRRFEWEELSVEGISSEEELREAISKRLSEYKSGIPAFLRLELVGTFTSATFPNLSDMEAESFDGIEALSIIDRTLHLPDSAYLEKDATLRGEFYRSIRSALHSEDASERAIALRALRIGLAVMDGKEFLGGGENS